MAALANEIRDHPMLLALLDRFKRESEEFASAQATPNQHREHRVIARFAWRDGVLRVLEQPTSLFGSQPIPETHTPDAADAGRQLLSASAALRAKRVC